MHVYSCGSHYNWLLNEYVFSNALQCSLCLKLWVKGFPKPWLGSVLPNFMFPTPEGYLWVVRARLGAVAGLERAQLGDKNRWGERICYWRNRWLWNERLYLILRFSLLSVQPSRGTQDCVGGTLGMRQESAQSETWDDEDSMWTSSPETAEKPPSPFRNDHRISV